MTTATTATSLRPWKVAVIHAGQGQPSTTRMLADQLTDAVRAHSGTVGIEVELVELRTLIHQIADATATGFAGPELQAVLDRVSAADGLILATPIYKATFSGLFKSFIDLLDNDAILAMPMTLAATGGSHRHSLAIDDQLRPLLAYLRANVTPTSVFATPNDWAATADGDINRRVNRAGFELATLMRLGVREAMLDGAWSDYQHTVKVEEREDGYDDIEFDTDLMRLATGGSLKP